MNYAKVIGSGQFPIDMLRQDQCFPLSDIDSNLIINSFSENKERSIKIMKLNDNFNYQKWKDHGWSLIEFL
jgi:hypothetical protein